MVHLGLLFTTIAMNFHDTGCQNNKKTITKVNFIGGIKLLFVIAAYAWFAYFSFFAFLHFQEEKTGLNQILIPVRGLSMPSITICSQEVFHDITNETKANMMLQNLENYVFTKEDLLGQTFFDKKSWNHHEIFSYQLGLCLTIKTDKQYDGRNFFNFILKFPFNKKYQV